METNEKIFEKNISLLKEARLQMLKLHKLLIDIEREKYERANGQITSGQFLNLLLNDNNFEWLRKFSSLIVEIDEMLDLDDGFTEEMLEKHFSQMRDLLNFRSLDPEFNEKYKNILETNSEVAGKHEELVNLLAD